MDKQDQIASFNPDGVGVKGTLFGLPFTEATAEVIVIPIPWDITTSYGEGTSDGPLAILNASVQLDYEQPDIPEAWKLGIAMTEIPAVWNSLSITLRLKAAEYIAWLEAGSDDSQMEEMSKILVELNEQCAQLMRYVRQESDYWLKQGKMTVLLGGDHSTPLGHINACSQFYGELGVLQIDAHADLRLAYEGFDYSHASIMRNALGIKNITKLVQVGVRDFCPEETELINSSGRITTFFDQQIKEAAFAGKSWSDQCSEIVITLPNQVYISFDIDGLNPIYCPNTGTPVPGGFHFDQIMFLFKAIVKSGRKIVGMDLCEVATGNDDYDANVGARALYRMINLMGASQGKLTLEK
jgi:agmatinase